MLTDDARTSDIVASTKLGKGLRAMSDKDLKEIRSEVYENVSTQVLEFAYYAGVLENAGRKKEAESLREVANHIEQWLCDARP